MAVISRDLGWENNEKSSTSCFAGSSFEGTVTKGDHLVPTLNALGVYSGGVGPSDFDHGVQNLERVAASLNFPLLLSNVV